MSTAERCFLVAEMSGNHLGMLGRALELIHAAKDVGADGIKFQCFTMDEILALRGTGQAPPPWESMTLPELYAKVITPHDWFPSLFAESLSVGLTPFASVFGLDSLAMLESLGCPMYKIAKPERCADWLIAAARQTGKPVLVSGTDIYCPGGYPCAPDRLRLHELRRPQYRGLSCHCPDLLVGSVAVGYGAQYVEFHLTLDDGVPTLDDPVNLTASQFRQMVTMVRQAEAMR